MTRVDRNQIRVLPLRVPLDQFTPGPKDDDLLQRYHLHGQRLSCLLAVWQATNGSTC